MFGHFGTQEIVLIIILAFLLLGPKRLPDLARSIGEGIREFKKSLSPTEERKPATNDREDPQAAPKG